MLWLVFAEHESSLYRFCLITPAHVAALQLGSFCQNCVLPSTPSRKVG